MKVLVLFLSFTLSLYAKECNPLKEQFPEFTKLQQALQHAPEKNKHFYGESKIMSKDGSLIINIFCTSKNIKKKRCDYYMVTLVSNGKTTYELYIDQELMKRRWKYMLKGHKHESFKLTRLYNDALEDSFPGKSILFIPPGALLSAGVYAVDLLILEPINLIKRLFSPGKGKKERIERRTLRKLLKKGGLIITNRAKVKNIANRLGLKE